MSSRQHRTRLGLLSGVVLVVVVGGWAALWIVQRAPPDASPQLEVSRNEWLWPAGLFPEFDPALIDQVGNRMSGPIRFHIEGLAEGQTLGGQEGVWARLELKWKEASLIVWLDEAVVVGAPETVGAVHFSIAQPDDHELVIEHLEQSLEVAEEREEFVGAVPHCQAFLNGANMLRKDRESCFVDQGGGWLPIDVRCRTNNDEIMFYLNVNTPRKEVEINLAQMTEPKDLIRWFATSLKADQPRSDVEQN